MKKESPQYDPKRVEQSILDYRREQKTFEKSITSKDENNPYRFYDGPPFITWLPHYGSLLSSVVKDIVTRYRTQKWKRIERVWWWDCHWIYVEQKVQEKLWYTSNKDIEEKGIEWFIKGCYDFTKDVSDQWDRYVDHVWRRVDFKNAYKTMDNNYMESVMWVFKSLWEKGLVYKGKRVSLYSTKLNTPISNYEVALDNSYADVSDPAITVKFPVVQGASDQYQTTEDWALQYVRWVIKDEQGRILVLQDLHFNDRCLPWWRVEKWESCEDAIKREIQEEAWLVVSSISEIWNTKVVYGGKLWYAKYFDVVAAGTFQLEKTEENRFSWHAWVEKIPSENKRGFDIRINDLIIDGEDTIYNDFHTLCLAETLRADELSKTEKHTMSFLARTTTPRTIPSNLALVVNKEIKYAQIYDKAQNEYFILAESLLHKYYKSSDDYIVVRVSSWSELLWLSYKPPFSFYTNKWPQHHKVYAADYVTDSDGTGIVHTAPEFGEEDFQTGLRQNLFQTEALDLEWKFTEEVPAYQGMYYRDANDVISKDLKEMWALIKKESITHSVAMCPRTWVPLIYKAQDAWFINIQAIKQKLFENNEKIHWVPDHLKHGRFLKSMESAPDRCISRTRFWATPMPVWKSEDGDMKVLWSLAEIFDLDQTGSKLLEKRIHEDSGLAHYRDTLNDKEFDLHRPYIDSIRGEIDGKKYTRIPEVLDPWLESGSMPYAQVHYPFENKEKFEASFPADYVAEYVWQVRAWFFFMHAISTMLTMPEKFDGQVLVTDKPVLPLPESKWNSPAFTNVVCTWVLAWNDGRKMSKSLGNYPDPKDTLENMWWDTVRMYLAASPIVVWGDMNFMDDGLKETYKKCILPLWNSYYFYSTYAGIDKFVPSIWGLRDIDLNSLAHPLDRWMVMKTMQLVNEVDGSMQAYNMQTWAIAIIDFMDDLTNRYIRRSRRRFREHGEGDNMWQDKRDAYTVLYGVLTEICLITAPYMPFITEYIYRELTEKESVHLEEIEIYDLDTIDKDLLRDMWLTQKIVSLWLSLRWQKKLRVKQPLPAVLVSTTLPELYQDMIVEELNVKQLRIDESLATKVQAVCKPNARLLWKKFGKDMQTVIGEAKAGNFVLAWNGTVLVANTYELSSDEYVIEYEKWDMPFDVAIDGSLIVALDDTLTDELRLEWDARDLIRYIQEARKTADYNLDDRIQLAIALPQDVEQIKDMPYKSDIQTLIQKFGELIASETLATLCESLESPDQQENVELEMVGKVWFGIKK